MFRSHFYSLENEFVMTSKRQLLLLFFFFVFFAYFQVLFGKFIRRILFSQVCCPSRLCGRNSRTLKTNISQCELNKQIQVIILCLFYEYAHLYPLPATKGTKNKYNHKFWCNFHGSSVRIVSCPRNGFHSAQNRFWHGSLSV